MTRFKKSACAVALASTVALLIACGAPQTAISQESQAKLFQALEDHNFDEAATAIKNGAVLSPICLPNTRCQPLATAAMEGDLEVMRFLIDNGADLDGYNSYDDVALIYALGNQKIEAAKLLVESGADVNLPNAFGTSPFIGATASGDIELIKLMIGNGAELDKNYPMNLNTSKPGDRNLNPLEFAIKYDQPEIISLLLNAGANPSFRTASGETVAKIGRKSKNGAIRSQF